jgi:hypothetical protein
MKESLFAPQNNPAIKKHFKLQTKTLLQNVPRDENKLEALLKAKETKRSSRVAFMYVFSVVVSIYPDTTLYV